ncbi:hypothetical protein SAMN05661096_00295 [Marivirga sericea]|uniref:Uncharacterized protein n=1 Tax=Marivirga sericea TaxID=1028 RepID=A0A1X7I746_9BACT|nr:hypothetical protein [Marivirga sericea]SMG10150.1 hypothetical protein SAMN05661096_00295 [Marivirga sericea]
MRKLSDNQKEELQIHLKQKLIEYVELYDEIYDHYASAYELGNDNFENIINGLDQTFTQEYIDEHRKQISKRIFKNIRSVYKKEINKFFRWPQIVTSVLFVALIVAVVYLLPLYSSIWYILFPTIAIPIVPFIYFLIQEHRKLVPRNLKSASYQAMNKIGSLFSLVFNSALFFTSFADNWSHWVTAVVLGLSISVLIAYAVITLKVFKQKMRYQIA